MALSFRGVGKTFRDGTVALRDVTFDIDEGEMVAVVGPSGCGKSTLLRIAAGLVAPTTGEVVAAGSGEVGFVFQDPTLLPWRTVQQNVELLGELRRRPAHERRQRAREAIVGVGLVGFEHHRLQALSGGMRMRVSLARALTLDPGLFLFDEPYGALDEITRQRLNDELLALFTRRRFAGLLVTHSVAEAVYLCTRALVMSPRPGTITDSFEVPFDFPRTPDLRFHPDFARLTGHVSRALWEGHEAVPAG